MGGSLLELLALGKQDAHLIGNPQITFFKSVHKRHTNFSIEPIAQFFYETPDFGKKGSCIIDRTADLLSQIILEIELPALQTNVSWINGIGHHIIKKVELTIGGVTICSFSGEFMDIYSELTLPSSQRAGYFKMLGKKSSYSRTSHKSAMRLFVPLPFWFCRHIGNVLPLIAMQYSEVKVNVEFRPFNECWYSGTSMSITPATQNITNATLYCDFIYLDIFERKKFATASNLEYLVEQIQISENNDVTANNTNITANIYFNHPVKELIWVYQANAVSNTNDWGNFSKTLDDDTTIQINNPPITYCSLKFNGHDRIERRHADYFRLVQPYQKHTTSPDDFIYVFNFCINPEKIQPTGTCNFSKIDMPQLLVEFGSSVPAGDVRVYAINYNILKIKNGMVGLMYSS